MPTDRVPPESGSPTGAVMRELQGLIHSLLGLYSQISSRMLSSRLETRREPTTAREGLPIEHLLGDHIERTAANAPASDGASVPDKPAVSKSAPGRRSTASTREADQERSGLGLFGALSSYFGRHRSSANAEPFLREKMRTNTLNHINKALVLAKQGDAKGAKIHAGLAESAMQTAGEYMDEEEYLQFKTEVETRLQATKRSQD